MRKINWKSEKPKEYVFARIGNVGMFCSMYYKNTKSITDPNNPGCRWQACTWIGGTPIAKDGPIRQSLSQTKEDAVKLARELLLDYKECLDKELKNFDLTE